jgi:hypothetical protein
MSNQFRETHRKIQAATAALQAARQRLAAEAGVCSG